MEASGHVPSVPIPKSGIDWYPITAEYTEAN